MNTQHTPFDLHAGQVITLPNSRDHWLLVLQGRVWLTQRGDADDHFLQAGQRLLLGNHGDVVIEADGGEPARCSLLHAWSPAGQPVDVPAAAKPVPGKAAAAQAAVGKAGGRRISAA